VWAPVGPRGRRPCACVCAGGNFSCSTFDRQAEPTTRCGRWPHPGRLREDPGSCALRRLVLRFCTSLVSAPGKYSVGCATLGYQDASLCAVRVANSELRNFNQQNLANTLGAGSGSCGRRVHGC
jgi:hypothetical protein